MGEAMQGTPAVGGYHSEFIPQCILLKGETVRNYHTKSLPVVQRRFMNNWWQ